jgi:hypothetical protein
MLEHTTFKLAEAGAIQTLAFVGFAIATVAFFVWIVWLVRE